MKIFRWLIAAGILWSIVGVSSIMSEPAYAADEWYAEYYNNSQLGGSPQLTRYEKSLTLNWGWESPGSEIPKDNFSARLTRDVWFAGGTYRFSYQIR